MGKLIDLTGQRFGRWTVLERVKDYISPKGKRMVRWNCICECGNIKLVLGQTLRNSQSKSCGCYSRELASKRLFEDLTGQRFGRYVVLRRVEDYIFPSKNKVSQWLCQCDCGVVKKVIGASLKSGNTKSCGCYNKERVIERTSGENCNFWKGGITPLYNQIRHSSAYNQWRIAIFERDNYTCQVSGKTNYVLNVHHIKPFSIILEENNLETFEQAVECKELWDLDNGITLTEEWHLQTSDNDLAFHKMYGTHDFTEQDFYEWFENMKGGRVK